MQFQWTTVLLTTCLTIAGCGGDKPKPAAPTDQSVQPTATGNQDQSPEEQNQEQNQDNSTQDESSQDTSSQDQNQDDSSQDQKPEQADPARTDFKVNKSCDASKIKPSDDLPIEIKIKACLHLRTDSTEAEAVTKRCGGNEDNIKDGNVCASRKDIKGLCRLTGKEYVLDYYPTDGSDWETFCQLAGGTAIELD